MTTSAWELGEILGTFLCAVLCVGFIFYKLLIKQARLSSSLFLIFTTGITFFYTLLLLQLPLNYIVFYCRVAAVLFLYYLIYTTIRAKWTFKNRLIPLLISGTLLSATLLLAKNYLKVIIYHPIMDWDARSIWYFRAKQLLHNNGFSEQMGICSGDCFTSFSHAFYSFMVPGISAFLSSGMGIWNEFLPKANLTILLIGLILALISLKHINILFRILMFVALISINPNMLINGYLDAWLGIFHVITMLFLCEYIRTLRKEYIYSCMSSLIFVNYIKNEGGLLVTCLLVSSIFILYFTSGKKFLLYTLGRIFQIKYLLLLNIIPFILWTIYKMVYNYYSIDYDVSQLYNLNVWVTFFTSEKFKLMYNYLIEQSNYLTLLVACLFTGLICLWYMVLNKYSNITFYSMLAILTIPILTSGLFFLAICTVYYTSLIDIEWHLMTSADRLREHLIYMAIIPLFYSLYTIKLFPFSKIKFFASR